MHFDAVPVTIDIPESELVDLKERLARTRWPKQVEDAGWDYGTNIDYLRDFCDYWRNDYDWRATEATLNSYPQYRATIDGVDIHFWHIRGTGANSIPLLLLHGWPGSIWEFRYCIDALTDFDLVIPCLPGFGFSSMPTESGWGVTRMARALNTLMLGLGHDRYIAQGGDWGGILCAHLGADYPEHVTGIHVNRTWVEITEPIRSQVAEWVKWDSDFRKREAAYSLLQKTKPDSLTVAQNDSPAGLAAWILEKFHTWGDTNGDLDSAFRKADLAANLMFYWLPGSAPGSARIYYELQYDAHALLRLPVRVPTAVAEFPRETFLAPRLASEQRYPIVSWTTMPAGGHFAALEQPQLLVEDIRQFAATLAR